MSNPKTACVGCETAAKAQETLLRTISLLTSEVGGKTDALVDVGDRMVAAEAFISKLTIMIDGYDCECAGFVCSCSRYCPEEPDSKCYACVPCHMRRLLGLHAEKVDKQKRETTRARARRGGFW